MSADILLAWMLCGLIVGLLARLLAPGRQSVSLLLTMVLGLVGAVMGVFTRSSRERRVTHSPCPATPGTAGSSQSSGACSFSGIIRHLPPQLVSVTPPLKP